ncbi:MurR/RpiR family transcriptional regulator [Enterococcus xiangfangensis]|uniref:MurR/RpiR family transcriptional regulator n=1 Tax=Enterococcus xiangfangensis TaxID=1296537 RepID=A0ABU3FBT9_9ENTE|nr:MurR/RpiR family transcriptional regulator [Enterococcus xiangfangensis]MDT2760143.1 MurR/RpiR family transcriptional regulator [Enterococcus xiangfangensis]
MNDVLLRIQQCMEDFSPNHLEIAKYILANPHCLEDYTARELAEKTYSVPSSIISFSKKIGYSGFQEMKFNYGNSPLEMDRTEKDILRPYQAVYKLLNTKNYLETVAALINAKRIYIFAFQMSQVAALDFYLKVHKVDPTKIIFFRSFDEQVRNIPLLSKDDIVLMISNSGECQEIIDCQKYLPKGIKKILVTNGIESTLSEFCTYELSIGCFEQDILTFKEIPTDSRNALLYLMDRIFNDMIKSNYDEALEKIKKSSLFFSNI